MKHDKNMNLTIMKSIVYCETPPTGNSCVILQREETSAWNADNWSPETGP